MPRKAGGHVGRNAGLAMDNPRQICPRDLQVRGQGGNGQTETFHVLLNDLARMCRVVHHMIFSLSDNPDSQPRQRLRLQIRT